MTQYQAELYHHGVKGQKWGVRRYQNADGSYTSAGKKHRNGSNTNAASASDSEARKARAKKIAVAAGVITLAAATAYVASNPKARAFVANTAKSMGSMASQKTKALAAKGKDYARKAAKQATDGIKEGIREGLKEAPKKVVKTVITGAAMYGGKKVLDKAVGQDTAGRIFKANDKKKVGSFWAYIDPDKKDDDDD